MTPNIIHYPKHKEGQKFVVMIDPSSIDKSNCLRQFELSNLMGIRDSKDQVPTEYGQGIHIAAADYYRYKKVLRAQKAGIAHFVSANIDHGSDWRDEAHFMGTVKRYLERYRTDPFIPEVVTHIDGREDLAIEMPFVLPLVSYPEVDFLLAGVVDGFGKYTGRPAIKDIKTTALWDRDKFIEKYRRSHQMKIYSYAVKNMFGLDYYPPAIIDAVFLRRDTTTCQLQRSPLIDFSDSDIDDTMKFVHYKANEIYNAIMAGKFIKNPSICDGVFQCPFVSLCWGSKIERELSFQGFVQKVYDPAEFGEPFKPWDNPHRQQLLEYMMPTT